MLLLRRRNRAGSPHYRSKIFDCHSQLHTPSFREASLLALWRQFGSRLSSHHVMAKKSLRLLFDGYQIQALPFRSSMLVKFAERCIVEPHAGDLDKHVPLPFHGLRRFLNTSSSGFHFVCISPSLGRAAISLPDASCSLSAFYLEHHRLKTLIKDQDEVAGATEDSGGCLSLRCSAKAVLPETTAGAQPEVSGQCN